MMNRDLKRIREDLDTVKSALGWDLPFNEQTIFFHLAPAAGGLLCMAWMIQPYRLASPWHDFAAMALLCLPLIAYLSYATVKHLDLGLGTSRWGFRKAAYPLLSLSLIYTFFLWAIATDLISVKFGGAAMVFTGGAILLTMAAGDRSRICDVGWCIGFMLIAVLRLVTDIDGLVLFGMLAAIGGLVGAAVIAWQLRVVERLQSAH